MISHSQPEDCEALFCGPFFLDKVKRDVAPEVADRQSKATEGVSRAKILLVVLFANDRNASF